MQGSVTLLRNIYWISMISIMSLVSTRIQLSYQIPMESLWHRLAGVQFGSGSGVMGLNLNLHLEVRFKYLVNLHIEVRFKYLVNLNPNWRFRFKMFGPGSNNVRPIQVSFFMVFALFFFEIYSSCVTHCNRNILSHNIDLHPPTSDTTGSWQPNAAAGDELTTTSRHGTAATYSVPGYI